MKKHILIIDDEASIRELLGQFLTGQGYQVNAVASSAEALLAAQHQRPDLIISDLQLEDSDGLEIISQLKATFPSTPVILLTGVLVDAQVAREILSVKVASYLAKTSTLAQILAEVRRLVG